MIKNILILTIMMIYSMWFSACSKNSSDDQDPTDNSHITSLMADRNLSVSDVHTVYNSSRSIREIKLMHVTGQDIYKDEIGFALKIMCDASCENYAYKMYIDIDHNTETGYKINNIGSDIRIGSDGYYRWSYNAWIPDVQTYKYDYIIDTAGAEQLVIVTHIGTSDLFKSRTDIVMTAESTILELIQTPLISVSDF